MDGASYTIYSTAWDNVSNDQSAPDSAVFTFDTTAPTITVNNLTTRDTTPQLTGNVNDAAATIQITVNGNAYAATNNGNGSWTLADNTITPALTEGTYNVTATATDTAGNVGTDGTANELVIDTSAPLVDAGADIIANTLSRSLAATVDASIAGVATYAWSKTAGPGTVTFSADNVEDPNITAISDQGVYTLQLTVTDNAANSASDTMTFTYDTTDPTITLNAVAPDPTTDNTPTLTGNAVDTLTNIASVEYEIDGSGTWIAATASDGTFDELDEDYTFTTAVLTDGTHTIKTRATDQAGNVVDEGNYVSDIFVVDTTDPDAPTFNSSEGNDVWYKNNPTLDIDFSDNIKINTIEYKVNADGTYRTLATNVDAAAYTANWQIDNTDWTAMAEGTNYLYFRVTDYAGNDYKTDTNTNGFRLKKDITNPNAPTYNTTEDQWFNANPTLDIDFSDARSIHSVEYQLDGTAGEWTTLGTGLSGNTYTNNWSMASGIWNALSEGQHYIYFRIYDDATNEYVTPDDAAGFGFKKDTTAPSEIGNLTADPAANTWTNDNTIAFDWDDSNDGAGVGIAGYSYELDHTNNTTPDTTVEGTGSAYTSGALADGNDWYFHVMSVDTLGNASVASHIGPFKIDTIDPSANHTAVDEETAGVDIDVELTDVSDAGSGIASVKVYYKHHGDNNYTSQDMNNDGDGNYSYSVPDEENSEYNVHYYIEVIDNTGNKNRIPDTGDYSVDIVPAGVDHFTFIYPTSGTRYAGTWFTVVLQARDQFNNVVDSFDGAGETVNFTTDESNVSVFVQETETNESGVFDKGIWGGQIQFGEGGGITPSDNNIVLIATDSDNPAKTGNVAMTTSGEDFGMVMGTVDGAETGTGGENIINDGGEAVTGGEESPSVQGEQDGAVVPEDEQVTDDNVAPWWKKFLPWMEIALGLAFVGWAIPWWIRRKGGGAGGSNLIGIFFSTLKTAGQKIRMFLW
ncbi:MAG: Ig-like domain-containing protein [Bacteroidota bacterium]